MSQYESNMDFSDYFACFSPSHHEYSSLLQMHSHEDPLSHSLLTDPPNHQISKQIPTSHTFDPTTTSPSHSSSLQSVSGVQFAGEVRLRNCVVRQGCKDDTMELNINFKTIICNHFRELLLANELTPDQQRHLVAFSRRSPSFKSLLLFCRGEQGMGGLCKGLVECSLIVRRILASKCRLTTKLNMIKFVEALRRNTRGHTVTKWKSLPRP